MWRGVDWGGSRSDRRRRISVQYQFGDLEPVEDDDVPCIGLVVDSILEELGVDFLEPVGLLRGMQRGRLDGRWEVIVASRAHAEAGADVVAALRQGGADQVLSASWSEVVHDVAGGGVSLVGSCPRLAFALKRAWGRHYREVPLDSSSLTALQVPAAERRSARALGMCFGALAGTIGSGDDPRMVGSMLSQVLAAAPDAISPLAACECARRGPPASTEGTA